ncbi:hypothetical protein AC1031_021218 [Aphanomyces cochlioides]|nr:hypothetical protein AC1031_021218 [Aphanomyces cochlioides]
MENDGSQWSVDESTREGFNIGDITETSDNAITTRHRKKFAAVDDRAPAGTSSSIMKVFDDIAIHCAKHKKFGVKKNGPALRTRFTALVKEFKTDQCISMRQSGTSEEFRERQVLLQGIVSQMDDWSERVVEEKQQRDTKANALLKSGEYLKRLAMDELNDDDTMNDADADDDDGESSTMEMPSTANRALKDEKKILRRSKITKSERIGAISDALVKALATTDDEQKEKNSFELQKMEFKRDQAQLEREYQRDEAARQREYQVEEAARRREHELAMEDRRVQADREREKMMQEFVLKILNYQTPTT